MAGNDGLMIGKNQKEDFSLDNYEEWYSDHAFLPYEDYANADHNLKRVKWILDRVSDNSRVLDLGCLDGFTLLTLAAKKNVTGVGIDLSADGIALARNHAKDNGYDLQFHQQTIEETDLQEKFDYVICSEVIEHVKDVSKLYEVIDKHLKPNGRVLLDTPDYDTPMGRENPDPLHIRYYTHMLDHPAEDAISLPKEIGEERIINIGVEDSLIQVEYGA